MEKRRSIEVLAPAGSLDSMKAAIEAGADAVYMGGDLFGARAYAENPDMEGLLSAIDHVHLRGRKLYLTVNTLLKEQELEEKLYDFLEPVYEAGVDALLIQDLGVWRQVREWFPDLPLHASTQMTVTGVAGALAVKAMGGARVVTARELSAAEIRRICREAGVEVEVFVHGAMCYCYSGQCLFSSLAGGRSGNRGRCAQPCRLPYGVWDAGAGKEASYLMNLKDLCGLDSLGELLDAGVDSLKIEGRMKSPRYTAGVVSVYRKYVDRYLEAGSSGLRAAAEDKAFLLELFDRGGMSDGYFHRQNGKDMVFFGKKPEFRQVDPEVLRSIDRSYIETESKEKIKGTLIIAKDLPAKLSLRMGEVCAEAEGKTAVSAKNRPVTREELARQVSKLGNTPFSLEELSVELSGDCFLPMGAVNELRRKAVSALTEAVLSGYRRPGRKRTFSPKDPQGSGKREKPFLSALVEERRQLEAVLAAGGVSRIYLSLERIPWEETEELSRMCRKAGTECYLALPRIFRERAEKELLSHEDCLRLPSVDGFLLRNVDELFLMERLGKGYRYIADHSLYTYNRKAREALFSMGFSMDTAPLELNLRELFQRGCSGSEVIVYGRLPMMVSAQCVRKNTGECDRKPGELFLEDRKRKRFPVKNYCRFCYNMIYNSEPLWLADEMDALTRLSPDGLRLQFVSEGPKEIRSVVAAYRKALDGEAPDFMPQFRTKGHFRRGVE